MAARYDVYESPASTNDGESPKLHARLTKNGSVSTEEIAKQINHSSSLTIGDVKGVLENLSYYVKEALKDGKQVHIEGLGYFQMTLKCDAAPTAQKVRGDNVYFKSVAFRPEKSLKNELKQTKFIRAKSKNHSFKLYDNQIDNLLKEHFLTNSYITRREFENLYLQTRSTALRRINKLVEEGKLIKKGARNFPIYEKGELL